MAVGEKIQAYRKALGISQEELGQRLLVSRQTISLWEKGQTMPTIDNLIRLKEIFGVSVDEILDVGNGADAGKTQPEPEPMPNEAYTVSFTKEELREIGKEDSKPLYRNAIVFSAFFLYWIFTSLWNSASDGIIGFIIGAFLFGAIAHGRRIYDHKKLQKQWPERAASTVYEYKIYTDYLYINLYRNNEKMRQSKFYFEDIEFMQHVGRFLCICVSGQLYYLRKSDLSENSFFYAYLYQNPNKMRKSPVPDKWKTISNLLFAVTLCTPIAIGPLVGLFGEDFERDMWILYLLTPIPIASIVYGCVWKAKGRNCKKNIIVGIIVLVLLCIFGSFTFLS